MDIRSLPKVLAQNPMGPRRRAVSLKSNMSLDLRNAPERATSFGDYRYNDKLSDHWFAAIAPRHKTDEDFLKRLQAIPPGFSGIRTRSRTVSFSSGSRALIKNCYLGVVRDANQPGGRHHSGLAGPPPFCSVRLGQALRSRTLRVFIKSPRVFNQTTEVLRAGMKDKLMPVRFLSAVSRYTHFF